MNNHTLLSIDETAALIQAGKVLSLAGDESLLAQLPAGRWIAGTIPYFVDTEGGIETRDHIFVTELTAADGATVDIRSYTVDTIRHIAEDAPDNGYTIVILPAMSAIHTEFANHGRDYEQMFLKPLAGWVAGVHLSEIGKATPKVFNGLTGAMLSDQAVALHVPLPSTMTAVIHILNLFRQDPDADVITFPGDGFSATTCHVNGEPMLFADYLAARRINTRHPLVADYNGARINTSYQQVDQDSKTVKFYAPVFAGIEYRQAAPIGDYVREFDALAEGAHDGVQFSCNCILNYLYGELQGRRTGDLAGPVTFGEIAYQLLNQTLVYLDVQHHD
ncbi:hypothetical protein GJ700_01510 [Duganella sp. FT92W]|uniref:Uncharacterized protein n=1 Tax=Pseudoduganella rivuli TaxID=2666085 RepID=A0A7X2LR40_9BURK|nr:hypothetical protein [Pseudoduganella rivuli]MRV70398.1 hypothetical protein [Pseudoduganella rivuli]